MRIGFLVVSGWICWVASDERRIGLSLEQAASGRQVDGEHQARIG
jgi:hypothetical protein